MNKLGAEMKGEVDITKGFNYELLSEFVRVLKKINLYIWVSDRQILPVYNYFDNLKCSVNILVWHKNNPIPTTKNKYLNDLEYCLFIKESGVKLNDGYELKSRFFNSNINKNDKDLFLHPTIKPLELVKRHILHSTAPNDLVLDAFCGSGTTCKACKDTGRRYIGFEIDSKYWQIANDRLNNISATGQITLL